MIDWGMSWLAQLVQLSSDQLALLSFNDVGRYSFQIRERENMEPQLEFFFFMVLDARKDIFRDAVLGPLPIPTSS